MPPIPKISETTRAALYARTASMLDADLSLSTRIRTLQDYAAGMGCPNPVVIAETRASGMSYAALQALTHFDLVVIQNVHGIGRSAVRVAEIADALARANVRVAIADHPGAQSMVSMAQSMLSTHLEEKDVLVQRLRHGRELAAVRRVAIG